MTLPATPTWVNDGTLPGYYQWRRLSWITWDELTSTYGIAWDEMTDTTTSWTQEA